MGTHAGATAEGQREMLSELGVTEGIIGWGIRSSMAVERVGKMPDRGVPLVASAGTGHQEVMLISRRGRASGMSTVPEV